jgi:hypothetical protein
LNPDTHHHQRRAFVLHLISEPGVDGIRSLRALLKVALRRFGLRALGVRECAPHGHADERALAPTREDPMSAFSDRIRANKTGPFRVADFEAGEKTFTISHLDEEVEKFGEMLDILSFIETGQQLKLNQTTAEWLLDNFGDDPEKYRGKRVTLYLAEYKYKDKTDKGIRLKSPGAASGDGATLARSSHDDTFGDDVPY